MHCSTPGFPVHHQLLELAQTHVRVSDAIQPSHPLSPPSPPAFDLYQHQGLFQKSQFFASCGQSIGASASVLPMNIEDWFPLGWTGLILQSKGLSRVFSNTTVLQHSAFFMVQISYPYMTTRKTIALTRFPFKYIYLATSHMLCGLSSPTRDWTWAPAIKVPNFHCIVRVLTTGSPGNSLVFL